MSFVGPRPALFNQDDLIALRTAKGVHRLIPGITVIPLPAETGVKSPGKGEEKSREKSRDRIEWH